MNSPIQPESVRPERHIALIKPQNGEQAATQAMQLLDSVLWAFRGTTPSDWTISSPEAADVIVITHADQGERVGAWIDSGKLMVIVGTASETDASGHHVLIYPFRATDVLALLGQLEIELRAAQAMQAPTEPQAAVDRASGKNDPWGFVESLRTLHEIQNAAAWLVGREGSTSVIWLRGDGSSYIAGQPMVQAIRRGAIDLNSLTLRQGVPPAGVPSPRAGIELAWFAGYHASESPAPSLDPAVRYRLTRWPDFGLIRPLPSQLRIAATLASNPVSLNELATRAQVPREEATRTLNALAICDALAVQESAARVTAASHSVTAPAGGLRSFLRSIRRHLGLGSPS